MTRCRHHPAGAALVLVMTLGLTACPGQDIRVYDTPYYTIKTDLDIDAVREAAVRVTSMYEEYRRATESFAAQTPKKMTIYIFRDERTYAAQGGRLELGGQFNVAKGVFINAKRGVAPTRVWEVAQHECLHQFAMAAIGDRLPIWVHEGLATYMEHGLWTGNSLITGVIPPERLKAVREMISKRQIAPFARMLAVGPREWEQLAKGESAGRMYDQVWSMIHFLYNAEDGKYRAAFGQFLGDVAGGKKWSDAWKGRLGGNVDAFEKLYAKWWLSLGDNPTEELYTRAAVETLASYLARAYTQEQKFKDAEEFFRSAADGKVKVKLDVLQWLPPGLLKETASKARPLGQWTISADSQGLPQLVLTQKSGVMFTAGFAVQKDDKPPKVTVTVDRPTKPATQPTSTLAPCP